MLFGLFRKKRYPEDPPRRGVSEIDMLGSNVWRRFDEIEQTQRLILSHLGLRIVSYPRVEKIGEGNPMGDMARTATEMGGGPHSAGQSLRKS